MARSRYDAAASGRATLGQAKDSVPDLHAAFEVQYVAAGLDGVVSSRWVECGGWAVA
jgi:hypothetical protein